jgi:putative hydrolase of the HAD superfamily
VSDAITPDGRGSGLLFIFDMDDVLYDYDWRARQAALMELTGLTGEQLWERWWGAGNEHSAEAGDPGTAEDYLERFNRTLGSSLTQEQWVAARRGAMTPRAEAIAAVARAAELGRVTLLTNNGALVHRHLATTFAPELVPHFGEHLFASSHYGARKPDPLVFERVLAAYGVDAAHAFFADDLIENVEGARSVGITAYHYGDAPGLLAAIEEFAARRRPAQ